MRDRPSGLGLHSTLAILGIVATLLAAVTVATSLRRHAGAPVEACRGFLVSHLSIGWTLVAGLALLVGAVLVRAGRALRVKLVAHRRVAAALRALPACTLSGRSVQVVDDARSMAFCTGLLCPRVFVSTGALGQLRLDELRAVLAHEHHHAARRDPLRRLLSEVLADALFFVPVLHPLAARAAALAEIRADAAAVDACGGDVRALASALLSFEDAHDDGTLAVDPERVDHLAGIRTAWRPPLTPLLAALGALAVTLALPVLAVERTLGATLDLDAFGAPICLAAIVAAPFAVAAALATNSARRGGSTVAS